MRKKDLELIDKILTNGNEILNFREEIVGFRMENLDMHKTAIRAMKTLDESIILLEADMKKLKKENTK